MSNNIPSKYFRLNFVNMEGNIITVKMTLVLDGTDIVLGEERWEIDKDSYAPADAGCTKLAALCSAPYLLEDALENLAFNHVRPLYISCDAQGYL